MRSAFFVFLICIALPSFGFAQQDSFNRVSPSEAGFSPDSLDKLSAFLEHSGTSSMVLAYDGNILFEWGDIYQRHTIHSIRKAVINSIYGVYVGKGIIDTSLTLNDLNIDDIEPGLTKIEKSARIADLLKSRSGVYHSAAAVSKGMAAQKPERGSHKPNEAYYYNNWDFNVLGTVFEKVTKKSIYEAFYEDIAVPIGMKQYTGSFDTLTTADDNTPIPKTDGFYQFEKDKSKHPAYHFRMSAHDLALYGTLYLNNGKWNGQQIIPSDWIEASTTSYSVTNPYMDFGYGMLWNVINKNEKRASKSFYHTGVGIHMLAVYPTSKLVFVHRVDTEGEYNFPQENLYKIISMIFAAQTSS
ncbi:MAG: amide hydrolase [Balneola sp.]|jgi:CubicO group peptidase (beta-lactamase class C family)|nr:amide hydrolase [Balneola sp.]MBE80141.1 amide hydrolase [Balneola sp.]MBE80917.1 amide hydrolase [Balneola sp.]|tara:strand:- start:2027 stop:3094 length:1068 start_codon:yes stop_codon:yes gene_type:complete